jgi:hypothetical protein
VRGAYLYWLTGTDRAPGVLARAPLAGGATEVLGSGYLGTGSVIVDDQYVYWSVLGDYSAGQGQVLRMPVAGGAVETVLTGLDTPLSLALDSNKLFVGLGSVTRVSNNIFNGQLVSMDRTAAAPAQSVTIADNQSGVFALAVDGTNVYWIAGVPHDGIFKATKSGGDAPVKLASGQASPVDIAVDDRFVYWINGSVPNGAVMRLPK